MLNTYVGAGLYAVVFEINNETYKTQSVVDEGMTEGNDSAYECEEQVWEGGKDAA